MTDPNPDRETFYGPDGAPVEVMVEVGSDYTTFGLPDGRRITSYTDAGMANPPRFERDNWVLAKETGLTAMPPVVEDRVTQLQHLTAELLTRIVVLEAAMKRLEAKRR